MLGRDALRRTVAAQTLLSPSRTTPPVVSSLDDREERVHTESVVDHHAGDALILAEVLVKVEQVLDKPQGGRGRRLVVGRLLLARRAVVSSGSRNFATKVLWAKEYSVNIRFQTGYGGFAGAIDREFKRNYYLPKSGYLNIYL